MAGLSGPGRVSPFKGAWDDFIGKGTADFLAFLTLMKMCPQSKRGISYPHLFDTHENVSDTASLSSPPSSQGWCGSFDPGRGLREPLWGPGSKSEMRER